MIEKVNQNYNQNIKESATDPRSGMDLRVGLVGLGPGPPHFGGPTKLILVRFYTRQLISCRDYRGTFVVRFGANYF